MSSPMSSSRLVTLCLECWTTMNAQRATVSAHVDNFLADRGLTGEADSGTATTIREILYGLERHKKLIVVTADSLYASYAAQISRSDRAIYELFTLLTVFKLGELGLAEFRRLVLSQETHKMHCLLTFLLTPSVQDSVLLEKWSTVYDHEHVETKLIGDLRAVAPQLNALLSELGATLAHASAAAATASESADVTTGRVVSKKESTVPVPFSLTQPKVRMLPTPPIQMDSVYKATPMPPPTQSLQDLEREALSRRRATEEATAKKYAMAKTRAPALSTDVRAATVHVGSEKLRLELAAKERATMVTLKANPAPVVRADVSLPKGTTATILREDLLHKRRLEERAAELAKFETELRDENEFHEWQLKMEALDDAKHAAEVAARKESSKNSAIEAVRAMAAAAEEKHKAVVEMKEDLRQIAVEKEAARVADQEARRETAKQIAADKANIAVALEEVTRANTEKAEAILALKADAEVEKRRQRALDLARKKQLIREIQAMEKLAAVRAKRPKEVDPTTSGQLGLLDEMSLVELQSRLAHLAEREATFLADKRQRILDDKSKKTAVLAEMQRQSTIMRREMKKEFATAKSEKLATAVAIAEKAKAKEAADAAALRDHLAAASDAKRAEALRLVKELRAKKIQNEFYAQAKAALAVDRATDLARAAVRRQAAQAATELEADKARQIEAYTAERNRLRVEKAKQRDRDAARRHADFVLREHRVDGAELASEDAALKTLQRGAIHREIAAQIEATRDANPYARKIADRESKRAAVVASQKKKSATAAADRDGFSASHAMADQEEREQIAALSIDTEDVAEEEKTQPVVDVPVDDVAVAAAADSSSAIDAVRQAGTALAGITLKRTAAAAATKTSARSRAAQSSARTTATAAAGKPSSARQKPLAARA